MGIVQTAPACLHLALIAKLSRSGRPAVLDKGCVSAIAKVEEFGVDRATLPLDRP